MRRDTGNLPSFCEYYYMCVLVGHGDLPYNCCYTPLTVIALSAHHSNNDHNVHIEDIEL